MSTDELSRHQQLRLVVVVTLNVWNVPVQLTARRAWNSLTSESSRNPTMPHHTPHPPTILDCKTTWNLMQSLQHLILSSITHYL